MKLKTLSFLLAFIILCLPLAGCQPANSNGTATPAVTTSNPDDSPSETTPSTPSSPEVSISTIICEDAILGDVYDFVIQIANGISELNGKPAPEIFGADVAPESDGAKLVIGSTTYGTDESLTEILREKDGVIHKRGDDFFIYGSALGAAAATSYFEENLSSVLSFEDGSHKYVYGDYTIRSISVAGVSLAKYSLVVPNSAGPYAAYETQLFQKYIKELAGYDLPIFIDKNRNPSQYEILIGNTNRTESDIQIDIEDGQYLLLQKNGKIVCNGNNHMVGAGLSEILKTMPKNGTSVDLAIDTSAVSRDFQFEKAENAILMIGDGMGFNSIAATEKAGLIDRFYANDMQNLGEAKTNSLSGTTDSAASATALATGYKTKNGVLGLNNVGIPVLNLRELAHTMGAKTAVLTTDSISGATPAAFLVHNPSRNNTSEIQNHINNLKSNKQIDFCLGNAAATLLPEFQEALDTISANGSNFFIMLEEAQIDWASHSNDFNTMYKNLIRFNNVIAYGMAFTVMNPNTVIIVTADHETGGITYNPGNDSYHYTTGNHSNVNVPVCAMGAGTEEFNKKAVDNTEIAKFISKIFGAKNFGP